MNSQVDITFITYDKLPAGDPDDNLALSILVERGLRVEVREWRDASFSPAQSRLTVLRSCWDYHLHFEEFQNFLARVHKEGELLNPYELVCANLDKHYLTGLQSKGIKVCPSLFVDKDQPVDRLKIREVLSNLQKTASLAHGIIVKPSVGLSTHGVKRFRDVLENIDAIVEHVRHISDTCRCDTLFQPYLIEVEGYGEQSLMYIDGKFSHAVRKSAFQKLAAAGQAGETSRQATPYEIEFGYKVLATLPVVPLYARVDVLGEGGEGLCLLELELTEPSLFLSMDESKGAAARLADALMARLETSKIKV